MPTRAGGYFSGFAFFLPEFLSSFPSSFLPAIILTHQHVQPLSRTIAGWRAVTSLRVETEKQAWAAYRHGSTLRILDAAGVISPHRRFWGTPSP
jgi:hypothetical protein